MNNETYYPWKKEKLTMLSELELRYKIERHQKWLQKKRNGQPLCLNHTYLEGKDFSNLDLTGASFIGANLENANFSHSILNNVDFSRSNLHRTIFTDAELNGASLTLCWASYSCFLRANLSHACLQKTDLSYAILADANLAFSKLLRADFTGAALHNVTWPYNIPKSVIKENCVEEARDYQEYSFDVKVTGLIPVRVMAESEDAGMRLAELFASEEQFGKLQNLKYAVEAESRS